MRLTDGISRCAGKVEFYDRGQWRTVCGESWDMNDASVVCRQLDCGRAYKINTMAEYGHGQTWIDQIECNGMESTLTQCPQRPFTDKTCNATSVAGVACSGKSKHVPPYHCSRIMIMNISQNIKDLVFLRRKFGSPAV